MSPYLCFITFLYLDLYVLGEDALISWGSFMQTKHIFVFIHIWTKGEVGAPLNRFKPSSKIFLLTIPRQCFFCEYFMLILSCFVILSCTSVCLCLVVCLYVLCGHLLGKGWPLGSRLWFYCEFVTFPLVSWVRCGTWLYRFLIFAPLLTLETKIKVIMTIILLCDMPPHHQLSTF